MQIVRCEVCKKSSIGFGNTYVTVIRKKHIKCCEHCNNTRDETSSQFFCSEDCYNGYIRECIEHGDF